MNSICIAGHIVGTPEIIRIEYNNVCLFSVLAHEKSVIDSENHFFKCEASGELAELIAEHAKDGMEIFIEGKYESKSFIDENKNQIFDNRITVEGIVSSEIEHMVA